MTTDSVGATDGAITRATGVIQRAAHAVIVTIATGMDAVATTGTGMRAENAVKADAPKVVIAVAKAGARDGKDARAGKVREEGPATAHSGETVKAAAATRAVVARKADARAHG